MVSEIEADMLGRWQTWDDGSENSTSRTGGGRRMR
jgi:hypothetical protein